MGGSADSTASAPPASVAGGQLQDFLTRWGLAAVASILSEVCTYPLDLVKTRLQLQNELLRSSASSAAAALPSAAAPPAPLGMLGMLRQIVSKEGLRGPFAGVHVAALRQVFNAGISVGAYPLVRGALLSPGESVREAPLWKRAAAGALTGCIAQLVANPFDVIKVRVQADGRLRAAGLPPRYRGTLDAFRVISAVEGARGFYTAVGSSVWRAAIINAAGIASYDQTKQVALRAVGGDVAPQAIASVVCGFVSAVVSAPLDVVKTRVMNNPHLYKGPNDALVRLIRTEGVASLYKGFIPTYQRQAIFNMVFWMLLEELQKATGATRL